jgi:hypothetical protein
MMSYFSNTANNQFKFEFRKTVATPRAISILGELNTVKHLQISPKQNYIQPTARL